MKHEATILVVDDDARLRGLLSDYLADQGFFVCTAQSATEAREKLEWMAFDVMVLDRMMPGETGLELAQALREHPVAILMLTAMAESTDRIEGLEAGVQDYLTKPFEPRELVLRLQNLLERKQQQNECRFGQYHYHIDRQSLSKGDEIIYLTASEQAFLQLLAKKQGQVVGRDALAQAIGMSEVAGRSIDVQINRLRKKIEQEPSRPVHLQTVRGEGYILK